MKKIKMGLLSVFALLVLSGCSQETSTTFYLNDEVLTGDLNKEKVIAAATKFEMTCTVMTNQMNLQDEETVRVISTKETKSILDRWKEKAATVNTLETPENKNFVMLYDYYLKNSEKVSTKDWDYIFAEETPENNTDLLVENGELFKDKNGKLDFMVMHINGLLAKPTELTQEINRIESYIKKETIENKTQKARLSTYCNLLLQVQSEKELARGFNKWGNFAVNSIEYANDATAELKVSCRYMTEDEFEKYYNTYVNPNTGNKTRLAEEYLDNKFTVSDEKIS
ncbi:hypothetical protein HCJ68_09885 [Listeria welshimeri]|nr:hypothetical protein [Listeria welshimeri]